MTAKGPALVQCPFPDTESARASINTVLDEELDACANILSGLPAHHVWQGKKEEAVGVEVLFKTDLALLQAPSALAA